MDIKMVKRQEENVVLLFIHQVNSIWQLKLFFKFKDFELSRTFLWHFYEVTCFYLNISLSKLARIIMTNQTITNIVNTFRIKFKMPKIELNFWKFMFRPPYLYTSVTKIVVIQWKSFLQSFAGSYLPYILNVTNRVKVIKSKEPIKSKVTNSTNLIG